MRDSTEKQKMLEFIDPYGSLCFYMTALFYTSTMLLYADYQFCFTPLYVSTHLRFFGSLYIVTAY